MVADPNNIEATKCSPFFGIKKVSLKRGFIIWFIQALLCGSVLLEFTAWRLHGINPLIRMW